VKEKLSELTTEEKAALLAGTDFMHTNSIPRLGIPSLNMADGPHGLRKQTSTQATDNGASVPATSFPTAATVASSWNPDYSYEIGCAIAKECRHYGVDILLGPGINIKRSPLCGRNFEYFSEDPLLAGKMGIAEVRGVQSEGVGVSVKHFALNNSENFRNLGDSVADDRALREIYLKAFEMVVKEAKPFTLMCAYNKINGEYCSENEWLLTRVLRREWGFDGAVMSDWGATHDRVKGVASGLDLEMPGDTDICRKWITDAVKSGDLGKEALDSAVGHVLALIEKCRAKKETGTPADFDAHHILAAEIAADSAVLLKNDGSLPLCKDKQIFIAGDLFCKMRYQGSGSSLVNPTSVTSPKDAFDKRNIRYSFAKGYSENKTEPENDLIAEAIRKGEKFERVFVFAGLTDTVESEGFDRPNMRLPDNQISLIEALVKTGKKINLVLFGGAPIELPFADDVSSVLMMYLPGQNGGEATAKLLFGEAVPSGKLAETWPLTSDDVPYSDAFGKSALEVYKESIFVGYRYYTTVKKKVRYAFGFGLSYTTFEYSELRVVRAGSKFTVSCRIMNTGEQAAADVVMLFVKAPGTDVFKPEHELRAFQKVFLEAGESRVISMELPVYDLRFYLIKEKRWVLESGEYEFRICSDSETVRLIQTAAIEGESIPAPYSERVTNAYSGDVSGISDEIFEEMSGLKISSFPPSKLISVESRFSDLNQTVIGRILYSAVLSVAKNQLKKAKKFPEGTERDNKIKSALFLERALDSNSLISMSMSSGKAFPYHFAQGFAAAANGHLIKSIKSFCTGVKAPNLPKDEEKIK